MTILKYLATLVKKCAFYYSRLRLVLKYFGVKFSVSATGKKKDGIKVGSLKGRHYAQLINNLSAIIHNCVPPENYSPGASMDVLRQKCHRAKLPTEGNRYTLIERLHLHSMKEGDAPRDQLLTLFRRVS